MNRFTYGQIAAYMRTTIDSTINKDYVDNQFLRTECFWWSSGGSDHVQLRDICTCALITIHQRAGHRKLAEVTDRIYRNEFDHGRR